MSASPHVSLAGFAYLEPLSRPIRVDDSSYNSPEHEQHRALELPSKLASLTERLAAQSNWVKREEQKSPGRSPPSLTTSRIDCESEFARSGGRAKKQATAWNVAQEAEKEVLMTSFRLDQKGKSHPDL